MLTAIPPVVVQISLPVSFILPGIVYYVAKRMMIEIAVKKLEAHGLASIREDHYSGRSRIPDLVDAVVSSERKLVCANVRLMDLFMPIKSPHVHPWMSAVESEFGPEPGMDLKDKHMCG